MVVEFIKRRPLRRAQSQFLWAVGACVSLTVLASIAFAANGERSSDAATASHQSQSDNIKVEASTGPCAARLHEGTDYIVCRFDPAASDIRMFLNNDQSEPYRHFNFVNDALAENGERLIFAMNAGMYHEDRSPVGFYREGDKDFASVNTNEGPGNFHLLPNGIFYITAAGQGFVEETSIYLQIKQPPPTYATQSGPMLVIGGEIHPKFLKDSTSLKRRNGVGINNEGEVIFVIADSPVRFYDFAVFFRDELKTPNALFLDGTISRLYAPELGRNDPGAAMGPIVGVVAPIE